MLNVFYVRPSDNGYYGIPEALLDQPRSNVRVRTSLFRSTQFPLTYPFPKRLDREMQGWYGVQAYNLIVLAGIDPEVLSPKEMRDLVAFVERGGGLLVTGGAVSGSCRIGTWTPLNAVLPVEFLHQDDVALNRAPSVVQEHFVTCGIPPIKGLVQSVHAVQAAPEGVVVMVAANWPLVAVREVGRGRVAFLNSFPQCSTSTEQSFFTDRFYGDLIRRIAAWLTHEDTPDGILTLEAPEALSPNRVFRLRITIRSKDGAFLTAVLKNEQQEIVRDTCTVRDGETGEVALKVPAMPNLPNTLRCALELRDFPGTLVSWRSFPVAVRTPVSFRWEFDGGVEALAPGMVLGAHIHLFDKRRRPTTLSMQATVIDPHGRTIKRWPNVPLERAALRWKLPDICSGTYTLRGILSDAESGTPLCERVATFEVVDRPDNEHYFPLVTETIAANGPVCANVADLRTMIDDAANHGFNALNLGGTAYSNPLTNAERVRRAGERYAQSKGLRLVTGAHLVPSFSRTKPPDICLFDPKFERAIRERLGPQLEHGRRIPRLFMSEILDEPLIAEPMVCRCSRCIARFRKRFGYDMPTWDETCLPGNESQRTDLLTFVSDYWAEIFRLCYEFKQKRGVPYNVHHTFCQLSFGSFCSRYYWRDAFAWMPHCDRFDWDTYPYIYPIWRGHLELRCPNLRYHFAGHRALARHFGKPMGHWLDLSDRNVPHWNPPVRASSELVYSAIGQDAKLIRTFWNLTFGRNNGVRRERWDDLGRELGKLNRIGALLSVVQKTYARLAMLFPATDWALRHHTSPEDLPAGTTVTDFPLKWDDAPFDDTYPFAGTPYNAFELLLRAFGEADILPEQLAADNGLERHRALAIWRTHYLRRDAAARIADQVRAGGLVLCDHIPDKDERGRPLEGFAELFGGDFRPVCDHVSVATRIVGKGQTLLFNTDICDAYTQAVLWGDWTMRTALKSTIYAFLHSRGVLPHARPTNTEFEVDVLAGQHCFLLVVVNHNNREDETLVELLTPPSPVGYIIDLTGKGDFESVQHGKVLALRLRLEERRGCVLAVYPERPVRNEVRLSSKTLRRGQALSYEVRVLNEAGKAAQGHHPVEITVTDSAGAVRARYSGQRATTDGVYRRQVALAENERMGKWRIEVRDPVTRTVSTERFEVL